MFSKTVHVIGSMVLTGLAALSISSVVSAQNLPNIKDAASPLPAVSANTFVTPDGHQFTVTFGGTSVTDIVMAGGQAPFTTIVPQLYIGTYYQVGNGTPFAGGSLEINGNDLLQPTGSNGQSSALLKRLYTKLTCGYTSVNLAANVNVGPFFYYYVHAVNPADNNACLDFTMGFASAANASVRNYYGTNDVWINAVAAGIAALAAGTMTASQTYLSDYHPWSTALMHQSCQLADGNGVLWFNTATSNTINIDIAIPYSGMTADMISESAVDFAPLEVKFAE